MPGCELAGWGLLNFLATLTTPLAHQIYPPPRRGAIDIVLLACPCTGQALVFMPQQVHWAP